MLIHLLPLALDYYGGVLCIGSHFSSPFCLFDYYRAVYYFSLLLMHMFFIILFGFNCSVYELCCHLSSNLCYIDIRNILILGKFTGGTLK